MTASTDANDRVPEHTADTSLFDILTPILAQWRLVVGLPLAVGIVVAGISLLLPAKYTASSSFYPETGDQYSSLAGLAGQLGLSISSTGASPDFLAEVVRSREVLLAVLRSDFQSPAGDAERQPLENILGIEGNTALERANNGVRELAQVVTARVQRRTGIITVSVELSTPGLAADVANQIVETVNQFNLERRQFQSREQRRFVAERLEQARLELQEAEVAHLAFLQQNRSFRDSPQLSFEEDRLSRRVALRQEVFVTLSREYEQARVAEVRDTPVLTIIDRAVVPDRRSFPQRKLLVFLAMTASGLLALTIVFARQYRQTVASHAPAVYQRFIDARTEAAEKIRKPFSRTSRPS